MTGARQIIHAKTRKDATQINTKPMRTLCNVAPEVAAPCSVVSYFPHLTVNDSFQYDKRLTDLNCAG